MFKQHTRIRKPNKIKKMKCSFVSLLDVWMCVCSEIFCSVQHANFQLYTAQLFP